MSRMFLFIIVVSINLSLLKGQELRYPLKLKPAPFLEENYKARVLDSTVTKNINADIQKNYYPIAKIDSIKNLPDSILEKDKEYQRLYKLFGTYPEFKQKFLAHKIPDELDLGLPNYLPGQSSMLHAPQNGFGVAAGGPISFLYSRFSKHEKAMRKYGELMADRPNYEKVKKKYNREKVQQWTGLQGDRLTKFVLYCHFDDTYLLHVNEYDLIEKVHVKLQEFMVLEDTSKNNVLIKIDTSKSVN